MTRAWIRLFDFILSLAGLIVLMPVFILTALWIAMDSRGSIFFLQERVGRHDRDFKLLKFRTMRKGPAGSLITVGAKDARVTRAGFWLRKWKLDELPQLVNVLIGNMSLVGPRPEVRKYVELYTAEQRHVLSVKPGITDFASIEYRNENTLLEKSANPEETYVKEIMPHKIRLNMRFIDNPSLTGYFLIILKTLKIL